MRNAARRSRLVLASLLAALALVSLPGGARSAESGEGERLTYRWRMLGFFGVLSSLFFPASGEGELTAHRSAEGELVSELLITSRASETPDFFRYGAALDPESGRTLRAWSSQLWRGKRKEKESAIDAAGVVDVASAIALLRRDRPEGERRLEIWSDGKLYPIAVRLEGRELRTVLGHRVATRHYAVRPLELPNRRVWKGELDLWLADDGVATPVEIQVARAPARVRLELTAFGAAP